jgi:uncharacterized membrane protein (UPF0127 family)
LKEFAVARSLPARPLLLLLVLAGALALPASTLADTEPLFQFPQLTVTIRGTSGHAVKFQVWLADTPHREEQGLMFVRDLDEHGGMLFRFPAPQRIPMWMKNTYIPLDMLFIDAQGHVDYIAAQTRPLSLDLIQPPRPEVSVLEIRGGAAERLGIHVGDVVILQQSDGNKP